MTRDLSAALSDEVQKSVIGIIGFFEGEFDSGFLRLWNGRGIFYWGGFEWTGAGNLIGISEISESQEVKAIGASVTLSGISPELLSLALQEDYQGRPARIYLGAITQEGVLVGEPYQIFGGLMDVMEISEDGTTASITLTAESRLIDLERPREHRYEHEDQIAIYPGDLGLEYVSTIQDKPIIWGRS